MRGRLLPSPIRASGLATDSVRTEAPAELPYTAVGELMASDAKQSIKALYDAFNRGEIDTVLNGMTDDVVWDVPGSAPFTGRRFGREQVREFFASLERHARMEQFDADEFLQDGDRIVVLGRQRASVRETGTQYDSRWAHVYRLRGGQIAEAYLYGDTQAEAAAFGETRREREATTGHLGITHPAYSDRPGNQEIG